MTKGPPSACSKLIILSFSSILPTVTSLAVENVSRFLTTSSLSVLVSSLKLKLFRSTIPCILSLILFTL
uniref:Uncharacterized protein n=1 Tax=Arundo donax TaxID=35708 RepID=A0A0A9BYD1_ARUDO